MNNNKQQQVATGSPCPVYYVCDGCGDLTQRDAVPEDAEWTCTECGSHAAWEFPNSRRSEASAHSTHIRSALIFKRA